MEQNSESNELTQIKELLGSFCSEYFDEQLKRYSLILFKTIKKKSLMNFYRGKSEIWAASIVYIIARLNFLFDKDNDNYISVDELCDYFNVNKSTIGNKASQIEKIHKIKLGDKVFTKPEIVKSFDFYMTPEGFVIPSSLSRKDILIEAAEGDDLEELIRYQEERERAREKKLEEKKARRTEINRKIAEEKRKKRNAGQLNLFDDYDKSAT